MKAVCLRIMCVEDLESPRPLLSPPHTYTHNLQRQTSTDRPPTSRDPPPKKVKSVVLHFTLWDQSSISLYWWLWLPIIYMLQYLPFWQQKKKMGGVELCELFWVHANKNAQYIVVCTCNLAQYKSYALQPGNSALVCSRVQTAIT